MTVGGNRIPVCCAVGFVAGCNLFFIGGSVFDEVAGSLHFQLAVILVVPLFLVLCDSLLVC